MLTRVWQAGTSLNSDGGGIRLGGPQPLPHWSCARVDLLSSLSLGPAHPQLLT